MTKYSSKSMRQTLSTTSNFLTCSVAGTLCCRVGPEFSWTSLLTMHAEMDAKPGKTRFQTFALTTAHQDSKALLEKLY